MINHIRIIPFRFFIDNLKSDHQSVSVTNPPITVPYFPRPIKNATAVLGRSAVLECFVENLGPYKVAWLKMGSSNSEPTVLTIGLNTLFGEKKYRVSQNGDRQWFLHIKHVRISDRGSYMCQVNAENMISQIGYLDVKVPPILIEDRTSSDTIVDEHQKAILKCHAKGYPKPKITWRREFGEPINLGQFGGQKFSVRPKIRVQNQLISSRIGSSVELVCFCEAHPKPIITWTLPNGVPIVSGYDSTSMMIIVSSTSSPFSDKQQSNNSMINKDQDVNDDKHNYSGEKNRRSMDRKRKKYETKEEFDGFRVTMILVINKLEREDFGSFKCSAKNLLGEKEGLIRVFGECLSFI
ncbi:Immunoglobulin domain containing protein 3 [Sarcoptes scabiei]|uniref:Immunoglobulin domain containing protein 3 n=1 Tax=Sarcoptes scabiei TaxID=52283 RepID=A0A132A152_SARSC|nr:Immunoglobulin domain containing protein 3 [Sarcoptes scabiei]